MATGSTIGHITFWDLEKKRLITVLRHAHANSVTGMKFLQRQPTMITSSPDNSLKVKVLQIILSYFSETYAKDPVTKFGTFCPSDITL